MVIANSCCTKKNGKFRMYVDFRRFDAATKKDPYPLPFIEEVLDKVGGHEVYSFLDGFFNYHQIMIGIKLHSSLIGELLFG